MKKEFEVLLIGRVQGVNFRRRIAKKAIELDLKGTVENLSDGSVRSIIQCEKEELSDLLSFILHIPFPVEIRDIKLDTKDIVYPLERFEIIKDPSMIIDQIHAVKNLSRNILNISDPLRIPVHVAIIADGNRRWAKCHGLKESIGHKVGGDFDRLLKLFKESKELGIKYLSFWVFSTENWKRDKNEINCIFQIISDILIRSRDPMMNEGIRFRAIGRKDRLPQDLVEKLVRTEELSKDNNKLNLQFLIDYGGRDEIVRAVNKILKTDTKEILEINFSQYLDTADIPDPDLIIRTSGEQRTSGLFPFQSVYAELYFSPKYFPDFNSEDLKDAVEEFGNRSRRFGGSK